MAGRGGLGRRGEGNGTGTGRTGYRWAYDCGRQLCGRVARGENCRQLCWRRRADGGYVEGCADGARVGTDTGERLNLVFTWER